MFFTGTVSSVMEGNVIALGICIISIDQASYYFSSSALAVRENCSGLTSQPLHTGWTTVTNTAESEADSPALGWAIV